MGTVEALTTTLLFACLLMCPPSCRLAHCNAVCASTVQLTAHFAQAPGAFSGSAVTICRNAACSTGTLPEIPPDGASDVVMQGDFEAEATTSVVGAETLLRVTIMQGGDYLDGDHYKLTIIDASGTTTFTKAIAATYTEQTSCETDCSYFMADLYP